MNENEIKKPKGTLLMDEWADLFEDLTMEQRGRVLTAIFEHHKGVTHDFGTDKESKLVFRFIAGCIDRYDEKYVEACKRKAEAGKRGRAKQLEQMQANVDICGDMPEDVGYPNRKRNINPNSNPNSNPKKERKNNNSAPSVRTRYEKIFEDVFLNRTGQPFSWNKREAIAVNSIIGKIEKIMLGQNRVPTPDVKADGFRWFLDKLYDTGDGWITSNFVPHVINDKFNEYYLTIKNGRNGKQNNDNPSNVSEEWLRAILTRNV